MQRLTRKRQAQAMTICANPRCGQEFPDKVHAGQQKKYCNRQCKNKHWEAAEYSDYRKRYLKSDKGKASQQRRSSKYVETQRGIDLAKERKIQKEIHRVKVRLAKQPNICQTCRDDIDPMTDRKTYCCAWCDWMGKHQLPKQPTARVCLVCNATHYRQKFCSAECQDTSYKQQPDYATKQRARRKSWLQTTNGKRHKRQIKQRRRARKLEAWDEDVDVMVLADWQNWKCYLCGKPISQKTKAPDSRSLSLDHLVPLSLGGRHSYANCAATHFGCNSKKQARSMNEQLKLC
jgi:predicted nucleic acid-binding Zn ribbon protein